jgi:exosome complex RNA-binding protein Csl4
MQELLENLDLVKARAASGTDESKTELTIAHKTIGVLQMAFW